MIITMIYRMVTMSDWWFGRCFIFPNSWDDDPIWLIVFRGVAQPPTRCFVSPCYQAPGQFLYLVLLIQDHGVGDEDKEGKPLRYPLANVQRLGVFDTSIPNHINKYDIDMIWSIWNHDTDIQYRFLTIINVVIPHVNQERSRSAWKENSQKPLYLLG